MDELLKGLEQDARTITERTPMNHDEAIQTGLRLGQFIEENRLTQATVARKIGVSTTVISQFVGGKYKVQDLTELAAKVVQFINSFARRSKREKTGFVETTVAKAIFTVIEQTEAASDDNEGRIGVIVGDAGHGKSVCLRQFAEVNPNSVLATLDETMNSQAVFAEIAKALAARGIKLDLDCSMRKMVEQMAAAIGSRSMIIMLDEASALRIKQLNQLRQVITVRCRCPLILSGNAQLLRTINKQPTERGYDASLDQFYSRLVCVRDLDAETSSGGRDGGGLYTAEDIRKLYSGGLRLTTDGVEMLRRICRTPGSGRLRTCSNIISLLLTSPVLDAGKVDSTIIIAAIQVLRLPVLSRLPVRVDSPVEAEAETMADAKVG
jgi:DNA transposition AAA+ family ATPase